jgi:thymidylate synthase
MILPRLLKASTKNRHGMYFQRLIEGGPQQYPNQLDFVISNFRSRKRVRRSSLQVAVYDARRDLTSAAMRGFPCLQHVTFAPVTGDGLNVNAFYATQFAFERAYGNYLGLCRLGRFMAHELGRTLTRVTCFTGIMLRDGCPPAASKKKLAKLVDDRRGGSQ